MRAMSRIVMSYIVKTAKHHGVRFAGLWLVVIMLISLGTAAATLALTTISQGYTTSDQLPIGSIVSLQNNTSDHVVATTTDNVNSILGVIINDGSSLLSLSNGEDSQAQVATSGIVQALVSDVNGKISQGDQITASPIKGVGMKATSNIKVVGISQGTPINSAGSEQSYTDKAGVKQSVVLGQVPILVNVSYFYVQPDKTIIPSAFQNLANAIAGKSVSSLPIIISAAIFLITLIVVASIVYSMIRSSIISVGRNPMSQSAVYRDVIQLSALVLGILAVSLIAIYMILTRF